MYKSGHNSKGGNNPRYNKKNSEIHRFRISAAKKGKPNVKNRRKNNGQWKNDNVSYGALHDWIKYNLPKPDLCQMCNLVPPYDLVCVTGIYNREFINWKYYCRRCHMISDD